MVEIAGALVVITASAATGAVQAEPIASAGGTSAAAALGPAADSVAEAVEASTEPAPVRTAAEARRAWDRAAVEAVQVADGGGSR